MKAFLMYRDRDFEGELPANTEALTQDLALSTLFETMAAGDEFLLEVSKTAVLTSLDDPDAITYRQEILRDCLEHPRIIREIYDIAVETLQAVRGLWFYRGRRPDTVLHGSVEALNVFVEALKRLRNITEQHASKFRSDGLAAFFQMLAKELDDQYFQEVQDHLKRLRFRDGVLISARLGKGNKGTDYILRRPPDSRTSWVRRLALNNRSALSFQISERDEAGMRALEELRGRGISLVANALSQSTDHILNFLRMLQMELAFYLGCINLHGRLTELGEPTCVPTPVASGNGAFSTQGLYDVSLSLMQKSRVVGNDVAADNKSLVMITGANQGGKSTFLRSVGLAQLMMQSGMFVAADSFRADVGDALFTHFKREEDVSMKSGKLDEELSRMSDIADRLTPNCVVLFNESFAATNEREGSEIARQVIRALRERSIKVFFVTHLFDLAQSVFSQEMETALFLRAGRQADGQRTFRLIEGEPLPTSYGEDVYRRIFDTDSRVAS
jgi:DNA mismatch repair ATPase MutS